MISDLKILRKHGIQYVRDLRNAELTPLFRGRPLLGNDITPEEAEKAALLCPTGAISAHPISLDMGKCVFCKECQFALPYKITFTNDYHIATNVRERLIITQGTETPVTLDPEAVRKEIRSYFRHALKLRQVSAGGDNSAEMELNAAGNVNFDMGRYGIEFVASPRHADGIVITGPVSANMADALQLTYDAVPSPKIIILAGTDAISGGIFAGSPALNRTFLDSHHVDLYVPGNPPHPLTFINGILGMIRGK
jgi:Ni,Fe-hydrogenase III small subunit